MSTGSEARDAAVFLLDMSFSAGVWVGAGCSLSEVHSLLQQLLPQVPEERAELFRALKHQLENLGNQQIRNVAVRRPAASLQS